MNNIYSLFIEFFRVGFLAFGGGMATIPFLFDISSRRPTWFSPNDIGDMLAISEGTPGPVGINMATYCGFTVAGVLGAITATMSLILPAFVVLYILSRYMHFSKLQIVQDTLFVLKIATVVLFLLAYFNVFALTFWHGTGESALGTWNITDKNSINLIEIGLFILCFALTELKPLKKLPSVFFVFLFGAITCIIF